MTYELLGNWQDVLRDTPAVEVLAAATRLLLPIDIPQAVKKAQFVNNLEQGIQVVQQLQASAVRAIALDTEYNFLSPGVPLKGKKIWYDIRSTNPLLLSASAWVEDPSNKNLAVIVTYVFDLRKPELKEPMNQLFKMRVPFIFHNLKAELFCFWSMGLNPTFINFYDTQIAAACIHLGENHKREFLPRELVTEDEEREIKLKAEQKREHQLSLIGQCELYGISHPFAGEKKEMQSSFLEFDTTKAFSPAQLDYACADSDCTLQLYIAQAHEIVRLGLTHHLSTVEFPFTVTNAKIEWNGVHVNLDDLKILKTACENATTHFGEHLRSLGLTTPGSRDQFLLLMQRENLLHLFSEKTKKGGVSTKDEYLEMIENAHPAISSFRRYQKYRRVASETWLSGSLIGRDGRLHPNHKQMGSHTGRNTCSNPNIVGIGKNFRPVVTAPPGRMIIELDYAQIEVGVAAAEYGDERLIEGYNSGDVYAAMAQVFYVNELSESERTVTPLQFKVLRPELRDNMKTFVLAVLYNIQSPAIASAFSISLKQAELARQRFLNLFPALKLAMETSVACGIYRGYATTVTGLKRHFNKQSNVSSWTRNFLRNTPIQASATIVFKNAVNLIHREYQNNPSILTILTAHDAVVIECPQSEGLGVGQTVKSLMKQSLRTYYPILRGEVEMNDGEPHCWNKKGKANSLRKFLENPEFSFGTNENSKR